MTKTKWLLYTVLIGLVPFFVRALIYLTMKNIHFSYVLNEVDMIAFGLVLNVSNITELDGNTTITPSEKTTNIGLSVLLTIVFACFLAMSYIADIPGIEAFDKGKIKMLSGALSVFAFFFSYSIFRKLN